MSDDVSVIAAGLSKAQRLLLLESPTSCNDRYAPALKLAELGLIAPGFHGFSRLRTHLTARGEAVRAHLLEDHQS